MALDMSFLTRYESRLRSVARVMIGFTFSLHGWQKLFGAFGGLGGTTPPLSSMLGAAGAIETIGGALIILGLFTRPVAFLLAGEMAIGYFRTHAPRGFWPIKNGGELAVFYCFFYLWLSSAGAGQWSLDRLLGRKH
ncbi:MAG TPA: DoxX family protein [Bryobacteraceae bacterium]|jgi:putative oxidoreductase|nr:DoxX family protein [Bryobacteraceae bacterium]